jgi:hypothetical protein
MRNDGHRRPFYANRGVLPIPWIPDAGLELFSPHRYATGFFKARDFPMTHLRVLSLSLAVVAGLGVIIRRIVEGST